MGWAYICNCNHHNVMQSLLSYLWLLAGVVFTTLLHALHTMCMHRMRFSKLLSLLHLLGMEGAVVQSLVKYSGQSVAHPTNHM